MRVLVTGGRNNTEWTALWRTLDEVRPTEVVDGGAQGFDEGAEAWCEIRGVKCTVVNAPFKYMGPWAGMLRNAYMLDHHRPELVIAGPGGPGTENCIRQALLRGIPVRRVHA